MRVALGANTPGTVLDQFGEVVFHGDVLLRAARMAIINSSGDVVDDFGGATSAPTYKKLYDRDATGNLLFEGKAAPGSATSAAAWQIKAYAYDAQNNTVSELWADGNSDFDNIYDDRAILSYS